MDSFVTLDNNMSLKLICFRVKNYVINILFSYIMISIILFVSLISVVSFFCLCITFLTIFIKIKLTLQSHIILLFFLKNLNTPIPYLNTITNLKKDSKLFVFIF